MGMASGGMASGGTAELSASMAMGSGMGSTTLAYEQPLESAFPVSRVSVGSPYAGIWHSNATTAMPVASHHHHHATEDGGVAADDEPSAAAHTDTTTAAAAAAAASSEWSVGLGPAFSPLLGSLGSPLSRPASELSPWAQRRRHGEYYRAQRLRYGRSS